MAQLTYSPQLGAKYVLVGPDGTRAVLNDQADADYVGVVTEMAGLDGAEVRESAEDLVEADGGQHGDFWFGRRPITFTVKFINPGTPVIREARIAKLRRATTALRGDCSLAIQNLPLASNPSLVTWVRRQQRPAVTGNFVKEMSLALVSEYAPLFGNSLKVSVVTASGTALSVENQGDFPAHPILRINGPITTTPTITNNTSGVVLKTIGLTSTLLSTGKWIDVDVLNHEATWQDGTSANRYIDWATTGWPAVISGVNSFTLAGGGTLRVTHRDAWA